VKKEKRQMGMKRERKELSLLLTREERGKGRKANQNREWGVFGTTIY
jgi:hypothetical protein